MAKKRNRGWSRGRKRAEGNRYPSGDLKPQPPAHALQRRAEMAGCSPAEAARRPEAGYAIGQLLMRGVIDQRQHDAGVQFGREWNRWALLAGLPAHLPRVSTGISRPDPTEDEWLKVRDRYLAAFAVVRRARPWGLVWAAVEMVVMDETAEPIIMGLTGQRGIDALRTGLDALAAHYHIGKDREVA